MSAKKDHLLMMPFCPRKNYKNIKKRWSTATSTAWRQHFYFGALFSMTYVSKNFFFTIFCLLIFGSSSLNNNNSFILEADGRRQGGSRMVAVDPSVGWTDSSYAKIIANAERILQKNKWIHKQLSEERIQANYGRAHYNTKYAFTKAWHQQRQLQDWTCSVPKSNDESLKRTDTILSVLNTFFVRFMHDKLLEYHDVEEDDYRSPQVENDLAYRIPAMDLTDSQMLRWMVNLVVDLHYPFNLGFKGKPEEVTKADYNFDQLAVSSLFQKIQDSIILPDISVVEEDEDISDHHPFELFHKWGEQTAQFACDLYADMTTRGSSFPQSVQVTSELYDKWQRKMKLQMELAAKNAVIFLKNIAVHRAHQKAHAVGRGRHHPRKGWKKDLMKNICVGAVVVPFFFWLMQQFDKKRPFLSLIQSDKYADGWGSSKQSEMRRL